MRIRFIAAACFLSLLFVSSPALAQQRSVVNPAAMRTAVAEQVQTQQQTREALREVLAHADVRAVAEKMGLDVTRADGAIATLTTAELERAAGPVRTLSLELAGGANTLVISTTTLLLILIIILLVA
jgi:hypothetical protein